MKEILNVPDHICAQSLNIAAHFARVAKLVDAADSKSAARKGVLVRFRSRAQWPS